MNLEDVKNVGEVVYPFIEPFYKTLITPQIEKLKKLVKKHSTSDQLIDNFFESKFLSYLERKAEEFNNVNVLAFQNEQILLKQIYYPLNIVSTSDNTQFRIELDTYDIIKKFRRLLINDGAGMGKSTIMKWIALNILETKSSIPVLINLRDLNSEHLILDEIFQQLEGLDDEISRDLFTAFLKLGNFTILMDGFDEIADNNAEIIVKDIKKLIALVPKNNFVLTSRPESSLSSFGEFQSFSIKELEIKEAYELIRKYDSLNQQKSIQEDLIQDIKLNLGQVKEFLINPFLTSILYRTYRFNKDIPTKKCGFYEEVISALYKTHDLSKNKFKREFQTTLDIQDIKQVLREVAKNTHKSGTIYNEQTFLQIIETSKKACPNLTFNNSAFLSDIVNQVPLFVKEGFKIRWAHKSLQDYFLAEYIYSNVNKEKIMQGLYDNKKGNYFNIIDFLIEMEPVFFQKTILLSYIKDFLSHCNSTYKKSEKVKIESIRLRQAYTFHNIFYIGLGIKFNPKDIHDSFKRLLPSDSFIRLKSIRIKDINELVAGNFEDELAKLFVIKRIPIFQEIAFKENIDLGKLKRSWKKNEIITLNDQPTHFLNDYRKFDSITSTLFLQDANYSEREFKRFVLSYDKCLKLKKDLEQSALEVESEDALFTI